MMDLNRATSWIRGHGSTRVIDCVTRLPPLERAAFAHFWAGAWARRKQLQPSSNWRSHGFLTGRGFGKTRANAEFVVREAYEGRAMSIGLASQKEDRTIELQVFGKSGLIACSPPWFTPEWNATKMQLVWPNGAAAKVFTPEVPGAIRGDEFQLAWLAEIQSWPKATMREALINFRFSTRLGYARTIWEATPKRRHPILRELLAQSARLPDKHIVVRGSMRENARYLGDSVVDELEETYGGTQSGREELDGEYSDEAEGALFSQQNFDMYRVQSRPEFVYKVVSVDPAITKRKGNDSTGIVWGGLGADGRAYICENHSGQYSPSEWGELLVSLCVANQIDCTVVETNKGGDLVTQNIRATASNKGLEVVVIKKDAPRPYYVKGKLFVRETHSRGSKADRARPVSTAYELGRVSHVARGKGIEGDEGLENTLATWTADESDYSPDDLDADVGVVSELIDLTRVTVDVKKSFDGLAKAAEALRVSTGAQVGGLPRRHIGRGI